MKLASLKALRLLLSLYPIEGIKLLPITPDPNGNRPSSSQSHIATARCAWVFGSLGATKTEMRREQVVKSIRAGKLFNEDFPTDKFGGILTVLLFFLMSAGFVSAVIFDILHHKPPEPAMVVIGIGTGVGFVVQLLALLQEDKLTSVKTGLNVEQNHKLVARCMQELDWVLIQENKYALVAYTSVWLRFLEQHIVVLIEDNYVYVNAKHLGNTRGRFPSLFGLNQRRINQLIEKIESAAPNISYNRPPARFSA